MAALREKHDRLFFANATVLLAHQTDAAYWHEWRLFGLPGGIQLFVVLSLPIAFALLWSGVWIAHGAEPFPEGERALAGFCDHLLSWARSPRRE